MNAIALIVALIASATACARADLYPLTNDHSADGGGTGGTGSTTPSETLYVAPDGDDANPGTLAQPLRTLACARDRVRAKNSTMTGDITVYLRGGTYVQTTTLEFSNADSGSGNFYVKYMAYPGERPLLTGGKRVTGWMLSDAANDIYSANAGATAFRQLYVNGAKAIRARSPNLGTNGEPNFSRLSGWDKAGHNVQVSSSEVSNWTSLDHAEMHLMTAWADNTLRIASISIADKTAYITFHDPEDSILFVRPNPRLDQTGWGAGRVFYFENALEFLDQPGEWYLNEATDTVYYKPRAGEDMSTATVIAPMIETIMRINGASTSDQVGHLWFQGLTFAHCTYMRPSEYGFLDTLAGQYNLTADASNNQTIGRPAAGVTVANANHIHFERNLFTQMAATALDFVTGTHEDMIVGNAFKDIGGSGISIGKFVESETTECHGVYDPLDQDEICSHDTIKNNYVVNATTEIQGACGIAAGYPAHIDIEHNEVTGTNYAGISVGYGWTTSPNAMTNNRINYNHIHDVANLLAGGAAISTLSNQGPASEIQYNYLHDIRQSQWADYTPQGLYLDEGTTGYTVAHNLMVSTPGSLISPSAGANLVTDNGASPADAEHTRASAGIEPDYADIKELTLPDADF
jgi:hypothetical protein